MPPNQDPSQQNQPLPPSQPPAGSGQTTGGPEHTNPVNKPISPPIKERKGPQEKQKKKSAHSAQESLLISEVRDGMVIMRDGSIRAVVMCQSINFDLMSPQEREGAEYGYRGFLNSLYFPIQIYIRSQRINLDEYMDKLEKTKQNQDNILLGLLMEDYIEYVRYLVEAANIMDKQFYVVVPYYPSLAGVGNISTGAQRFTELLKPKKPGVITINETDFRKYKQELTQRVRIVAGGLNQMGVQSIPLNTQELIELYYNVYNPVTARNEPLTDVNELESPLIDKGEGDASQVLNGGGV